LALAFLCASGGNAVLRLLKTMSPEALWEAAPSQLKTYGGLSAAAAQRFTAAKISLAPRPEKRDLEATGLRFAPYGTPAYPEQLANLSHPPAGLFFKGAEEKLQSLVALPRVTMVGTRRASPYGVRAARDLAAAFAARGIAVVSGMALGIDGHVHEAVLEGGGLTAAVLGCGADIVYPAKHRGLYQLIAKNGVVLSELPPGAPPTQWTFPNRNRLLAALGDAVVVVEGPATSGAMQTADQAAGLGRPVFAVPGSIYVDNNRGCNLLLRDGATPVLDPDLTVEEFLLQTRIERGKRWPPECESGTVRRPVGQDPFRDLVAAGREHILDAIAERPCSIDALVVRTGMPARQLSAAMAELELAGLATRAGPGLYIRAP
jgi:DNA processing protein